MSNSRTLVTLADSQLTVLMGRDGRDGRDGVCGCTGGSGSLPGPEGSGSSLSTVFTAQLVSVPNGVGSVSTSTTMLHGGTRVRSIQAVITSGLPGVSNMDMGVAGDPQRFDSNAGPSAGQQLDSVHNGINTFIQPADDEVLFTFNTNTTGAGGQIYVVAWREVSTPPTGA